MTKVNTVIQFIYLQHIQALGSFGSILSPKPAIASIIIILLTNKTSLWAKIWTCTEVAKEFQ